MRDDSLSKMRRRDLETFHLPNLYRFDQWDVELEQDDFHRLEMVHYFDRHESEMMHHLLAFEYVHLHHRRYFVRRINHIYLD